MFLLGVTQKAGQGISGKKLRRVLWNCLVHSAEGKRCMCDFENNRATAEECCFCFHRDIHPACWNLLFSPTGFNESLSAVCSISDSALAIIFEQTQPVSTKHVYSGKMLTLSNRASSRGSVHRLAVCLDLFILLGTLKRQPKLSETVSIASSCSKGGTLAQRYSACLACYGSEVQPPATSVERISRSRAGRGTLSQRIAYSSKQFWAIWVSDPECLIHSV